MTAPCRVDGSLVQSLTTKWIDDWCNVGIAGSLCLVGKLTQGNALRKPQNSGRQREVSLDSMRPSLLRCAEATLLSNAVHFAQLINRTVLHCSGWFFSYVNGRLHNMMQIRVVILEGMIPIICGICWRAPGADCISREKTTIPVLKCYVKCGMRISHWHTRLPSTGGLFNEKTRYN